MSDMDATTTAAFDAIQRGWGFLNPFMSRDIADAVLAASRPLIVKAERQRIRQLAISEAEKYDDVIEPQHHAAAGALRLFADLLDGDSDAG